MELLILTSLNKSALYSWNQCSEGVSNLALQILLQEISLNLDNDPCSQNHTLFLPTFQERKLFLLP